MSQSVSKSKMSLLSEFSTGTFRVKKLRLFVSTVLFRRRLFLQMAKSQNRHQRKISSMLKMTMSQSVSKSRVSLLSEFSTETFRKKLRSFVSTVLFRRRLFLQMAKSQNRHQRTMSSIVKNDYVPGTSTELEGTQRVEQFFLGY